MLEDILSDKMPYNVLFLNHLFIQNFLHNQLFINLLNM
jgi:hypothetical protein